MDEIVVIDGEIELELVNDLEPELLFEGGGSQPTGTKSILLTEAGTKTEDVADYAYAEINAVTSATASGAVVSFSDGAEDVPMDSCLVNIEPVQSGSGDPSPSNVRPISGWSEVKVTRVGKNLLNFDDVLENAYIAGNTMRIAEISGANVWYANVPKNTQITYSADKGNRLVIAGYKVKPTTLLNSTADALLSNSGSQVLTKTFNSGENTFVAIYPNRGQENKPTWIQLQIGSTATDYEPYISPTEYPVSLGQTVYGGTLDVVSGVLTVDMASIDLGSLTWASFSANGRTAFRAIGQIDGVPIGGATGKANALCTQYNVVQNSYIGNTSYDNVIAVGAYWSDGCNVYIYDSAKTSMTNAQFKTAMNGVQLVYELATPTTVQLTPTEVTTLLGSNSVWADSGDISVGYKADIFLYADSLETIIDTLTGGA